jgi:putative transposase
LKRGKSRRIAERNVSILERIKELKKEHPLWGYRRVWAYLKYREGLPVNRKRIYRLMKEHNLLVTKENKAKAKQGKYPYKPKPRATAPNTIFGIDMTKIMIQGEGWSYLHVVLDWHTKKVVGWFLSRRSRTSEWLVALNSALNYQFPLGIKDMVKDHALRLVSDNGSQPTSVRFMKACRELAIKQIFTSYNNPKGNADTERVFRTLKEDLIWIQEFSSFDKLEQALEGWFWRYNNDYPHSSLNHMTPCQYEENYYRGMQKSEEETQLIFA